MRLCCRCSAAAAALACAPAGQIERSRAPGSQRLLGPGDKNDMMPADLKDKLPPNTVILTDTGRPNSRAANTAD